MWKEAIMLQFEVLDILLGGLRKATAHLSKDGPLWHQQNTSGLLRALFFNCGSLQDCQICDINCDVPVANGIVMHVLNCGTYFFIYYKIL